MDVGVFRFRFFKSDGNLISYFIDKRGGESDVGLFFGVVRFIFFSLFGFRGGLALSFGSGWFGLIVRRREGGRWYFI